MPDPFINTTDLADLLGRDVTSDTGAIIAVDAACDVVRDIAEQSFNAGTATISLDGMGTDVLLLPERPVTTVGTVTISAGTTTETITEYECTTTGMLLRGSAGSDPRPTWPRGRQNVQVTYEYGFGTANMPRSVKLVALQLAARIVGQGLARRETIGDAQIEYGVPAATDLSANELRILQRYRQPHS